KRSMIYIDHLSHHISLLISYQLNGIYHPQNKNYVSTLNMVERIAKVNAKRIVLIPFPTIIKNNLVKISVFNKLFADLYYSKDMSDIQLEYNDWDFEKTIEISEKN
ncbi:TPA: NAD-dependent epimerase, partial [Streptococcus suis]